MFGSAPGTLLLRLNFAQRILGLELVEQDDAQAAFRSDFRDHTLVFTKDPRAGHTIGFEVRDTEALERAADALAQNGYEITAGSPEAAGRRKVKTFLSFNASGVTMDLVVRPLQSGWRYFPSRDAGITGLEAVALRSTSVTKAKHFGQGALGKGERLGRRCRLHPLRQCPSQAGAASLVIERRAGRRVRCRERRSAHAEQLLPAGSASSHRAWTRTPTCVRSDVSDLRRPRWRSLQLRR